MFLSCADPHDRLTRSLELAGDLRNRRTFSQEAQNLSFLCVGQCGRSSKLFSVSFGPFDATVRAFNERVSLEFSNSINYLHCHLPDRAGQINAAQRQAMHVHASRFQLFDGGAHIHRITPQPVELGDN